MPPFFATAIASNKVRPLMRSMAHRGVRCPGSKKPGDTEHGAKYWLNHASQTKKPVQWLTEPLMWCGIVSVLLGVAGWFVTSFFAKPLLDFWNLRSQVQEEIIFTANIAPIAADDSRYRKTVDSLRRLGAKVLAMNITESRLLRRYLSKCKYDLGKAGCRLIYCLAFWQLIPILPRLILKMIFASVTQVRFSLA